MKNIFTVPAFICLLLLTGSTFAMAQSSSSSKFNKDGLTMFGSIFFTESGFAIEGLNKDENRTPYVFICGEPGKTIRVEGKDRDDLRNQFVADHADCFINKELSKVQVIGPSGAIFTDKNIASCRCTEAQIDAFFIQQACQNHDRFLSVKSIELACKGLMK